MNQREVRSLGAVLAFGTLTACSDGDPGPTGAQLLVPDDIELHWSESFNGGEDGLGALVPIDVMVYEAISGEPLVDAAVALEASDGATWLLLDEDFAVIDPEEVGDTASDVVWDAHRDQFLALRAPELDELDLGPHDSAESPEARFSDLPDLHRIALETDANGLARVYLYVDAFPWVDGQVDFSSVSVLVSLGTDEDPAAWARESFDLIPR